MIITHNAVVDFKRRHIIPPMEVMQGDTNTRLLEIHLYDGGEEWLVPDSVNISLGFRKPDGASGIYDTLPDGSSAISVDGNVVTIAIAPQVLTAYGIVASNVLFHDANLNQLSSFPVFINVTRNPSAGGGVSNDYYSYQNLADINAALAAHDTALQNQIDDWMMDGSGYLYLLAGGSVVVGPIGPFQSGGSGSGGVTDEYINSLIGAKLGVIENGTY